MKDGIQSVRDQCGRAIGFAVAAILEKYKEDGTLPNSNELAGFLDHHMNQKQLFSPEVQQVVIGMIEGLLTGAEGLPPNERL